MIPFDKNRTVLVDMDGTLMNNKHREGFLRTHPRQWKAYNDHMRDDTAYEIIVTLIKALREGGCCIVILTARNAKPEIIETTQYQLDDVCNLKGYYEDIFMRGANDNRPDQIVKLELIKQIEAQGYNVLVILEDRNRVVEAERVAGYTVLQVQDGNF